MKAIRVTLFDNSIVCFSSEQIKDESLEKLALFSGKESSNKALRNDVNSSTSFIVFENSDDFMEDYKKKIRKQAINKLSAQECEILGLKKFED